MCIWKFKFASRIMWILQYLRDIYLPGVFVLWKITIFLQLKICVNYFSLKFDAMTIQFYDLLFIFCLNISFFLVISYLCLHLMKRARLLLRKRHTVPPPILEQCYCSKHYTGSSSSEWPPYEPGNMVVF